MNRFLAPLAAISLALAPACQLDAPEKTPSPVDACLTSGKANVDCVLALCPQTDDRNPTTGTNTVNGSTIECFDVALKAGDIQVEADKVIDVVQETRSGMPQHCIVSSGIFGEELKGTTSEYCEGAVRTAIGQKE